MRGTGCSCHFSLWRSDCRTLSPWAGRPHWRLLWNPCFRYCPGQGNIFRLRGMWPCFLPSFRWSCRICRTVWGLWDAGSLLRSLCLLFQQGWHPYACFPVLSPAPRPGIRQEAQELTPAVPLCFFCSYP